MGIPCLHEDITRAVMERFHFVPDARELAAEANAAVDEKQGNSAGETNLHAMCGYVNVLDPVLRQPMLVLQTADQCQASVEGLLLTARDEICTQVSSGNYRTALRLLGAALHTIQDRAFHNFEPWPYNGLVGAVLADPGYMLCHAIRDLGLYVGGVGVGISRLDIWDLPAGRFDLELSARIGGRVFLGGRVFVNPTVPDPLHPVPGRDGSVGPLGVGGMLSLTFGAAPGSVPAPDRFPSSVPLAPPGKATWSMATGGPAAQARAEDASAEFIDETRRHLSREPRGLRAWNAFVSSSGDRDAEEAGLGRPVPTAQFATPIH
jgi:hypothetical protein